MSQQKKILLLSVLFLFIHSAFASVCQLQITEPKNHATIRNNNAIPYTVHVTTTPALMPNETVQLSVDNKLTFESKTTTFTLSGVNRGEHQLKATRTINDNIACRSAPITVYFQQNRVAKAQGVMSSGIPSAS